MCPFKINTGKTTKKLLEENTLRGYHQRGLTFMNGCLSRRSLYFSPACVEGDAGIWNLAG